MGFDSPTKRTPLNRLIDHTLLKADATGTQIAALCAEALTYRFASVCVNGCWVREASGHLAGSGVPVAAVVGFPLGAMTTEAKCFEAAMARDQGAQEVDVVINIGRLIGGETSRVAADITAVVKAAAPASVKVIIECCLLSEALKELAIGLVRDSGAAFVKTSTGLSTGGATLDDVRLMRGLVGPNFGVKAAGGIRDWATAQAMVDAGANRLGTSAGVAIVRQLDAGVAGY